MELAAVYIILCHGGGKLCAVFRSGDDGAVAVSGIEGVDKVNAVPFLNIGKEGMILPEPEGIPADVGDLVISGDHIGNGPDTAGDQTQTLMEAVFIASFKEHLHT